VSLPQSLLLSLPLSHQPVTRHINLSLINLSNMSLSPILNYILSHGSHTKDTSHTRCPKSPTHTSTKYMYQPSINLYHNHESTMHQHLYHTKSCINHAPTHVITIPSILSIMYQPCTSITIPCINIVSYHVPYNVPTMHINHVHQPSAKITNKCLNHMPYQEVPQTCDTIPKHILNNQ
jgi:hypothetical protein